MLTPLAPTQERLTHAPTQALYDALVEAGWGLSHIQENTARLRHPHADEPITVVRGDDPLRFVAVLLGDRQVPFRVATEYARAAI